MGETLKAATVSRRGFLGGMLGGALALVGLRALPAAGAVDVERLPVPEPEPPRPLRVEATTELEGYADSLRFILDKFGEAVADEEDALMFGRPVCGPRPRRRRPRGRRGGRRGRGRGRGCS